MFDPILDSAGKQFWFSFQTSGESNDAVTLWSNSQIKGICQKNKQWLDEAVCFRSHYLENIASLFDDLLATGGQNLREIDMNRRDEIHKIISHCIHVKDFHFLRLAHLANAFGSVSDVKTILSVGCGPGYQEAFLAGRFPNIQVDATDLKLTGKEYSFENIRFREQDILNWSDTAEYDFVFSIETLEHIEDYATAFKNVASKVKPGKYLYISVPFASLVEQQDPILREREWKAHEHYLPGLNFDDLEPLFIDNGFHILHAANMFYTKLANRVFALLHIMPPKLIESALGEIARLFMLDISDTKHSDRSEALGIKVLGQKIE